MGRVSGRFTLGTRSGETPGGFFSFRGRSAGVKGYWSTMRFRRGRPSTGGQAVARAAAPPTRAPPAPPASCLPPTFNPSLLFSSHPFLSRPARARRQARPGFSSPVPGRTVGAAADSDSPAAAPSVRRAPPRPHRCRRRVCAAGARPQPKRLAARTTSVPAARAPPYRAPPPPSPPLRAPQGPLLEPGRPEGAAASEGVGWASVVLLFSFPPRRRARRHLFNLQLPARRCRSPPAGLLSANPERTG